MLKRNILNFQENKNLKTNTLNFSLNDKKNLNKKDALLLLKKDSLEHQELITLLEHRALGIVDFLLIDNREINENKLSRIKNTDYLISMQSFHNDIKILENKKETACVLYCLSGGRSSYVQNLMKNMGFESVCNLNKGIYAFDNSLIENN